MSKLCFVLFYLPTLDASQLSVSLPARGRTAYVAPNDVWRGTSERETLQPTLFDRSPLFCYNRRRGSQGRSRETESLWVSAAIRAIGNFGSSKCRNRELRVAGVEHSEPPESQRSGGSRVAFCNSVRPQAPILEIWNSRISEAESPDSDAEHKFEKISTNGGTGGSPCKLWV